MLRESNKTLLIDKLSMEKKSSISGSIPLI